MITITIATTYNIDPKLGRYLKKKKGVVFVGAS